VIKLGVDHTKKERKRHREKLDPNYPLEVQCLIWGFATQVSMVERNCSNKTKLEQRKKKKERLQAHVMATKTLREISSAHHSWKLLKFQEYVA